MSFKIDTKQCHITNTVFVYPTVPSSTETYDFVVVGAGQAGCVIANRLSQNGSFSVCLLEAGRDDARLPELLPEPSFANVPQPGDFKWGGYIRTISTVAQLESRGFLNEWFFAKNTEDPTSRSISYPRVFGWGGCTSHNRTISVRNAPFNWNSWGLNEWTYDSIKQYYLLVENKSQQNLSGFIYYNPALPSGTQGSFHSDYGTNGAIQLLWNVNTTNSPLLGAVNSTVNYINSTYSYNIPLNVDLDNPDIAAQGGTSLGNYSQIDPYSSFLSPNTSTRILFSDYNLPIYGDTGYSYPPELSFIGLKGKAPTQRVNSSYAYLYPIQSRRNLTIKSEVLVTSLITQKVGQTVNVMGVNYIQGWNIYQAGRNVSMERGGYGGTPGDAKANYMNSITQFNGRIIARKEVILCAGFINTPQILLLSGIGDPTDLNEVGITSQLNLPVGKSLIDNPECFPFWQTSNNFSVIGERVFMSVKSDPSQPTIDFDIGLNSTTLQSVEAEDNTIQYGYGGTKNLGALDNQFVRNNPNNILIDPVLAGNPYVYSPATFNPIYTSPSHRMCMLVEQVQNVSSSGFLKLVSNNPTQPPLFVENMFANSLDAIKWVNVWKNVILPTMIGFGATTHASPFIVSGPLSSTIPVVNGGSGHKSSPIVLLNGIPLPCAVANISSGVVTSITTNVGGSGYTSSPIVMFYGGGADQTALATCTISNGSVISVLITNGGSGYKTAPRVLFLGGGCQVKANATCVLQNGQVQSVSIDGLVGGTIDFGYYFTGLLDPAPYDILNDGVLQFTDMSQVNDVKLLNYLKSRVGGHHAGGTCKMGLQTDPTAVTNQKGQVYGTTGLRICDMSIVPVAIRWPNSTLYVVAEKIANDIIYTAQNRT